MENFIIKKTDIYIAEILIFEDSQNDCLITRELNDNERIRKVLIKNNMMIDLLTGNIIYGLDISANNVVKGPIYKNHMYCNNIIVPEINMISDDDLLRAVDIYNSFLKKNELIKSRKIILLPQEKLY